MLRVIGVKFGPRFDPVLIGDARQREVFTLTAILLLGVLIKQDIVQSKLLISQGDDSVNIIVVKELLYVIMLTDVSGRYIYIYIYIYTHLLTPRFNVRCSPCLGVALHHCHVCFDSWGGLPYAMNFYFEPMMHVIP